MGLFDLGALMAFNPASLGGASSFLHILLVAPVPRDGQGYVLGENLELKYRIL